MIYAIAVVAITPEYLRLVGWARSLYMVTISVSFSNLVSEPAALVSMMSWLGFALVRPRGNWRECCEVALAANISLLAIAFIQYKGYHYHYYPAFATAMLLLVLLVIESRG